MRALTLGQLAQWLGCPVPPAAGEVQVTGVAFDSRQVQPGQLFVALVGEKTDGHLYLPQAAQRGAKAALVSRPQESPLPQLVVPDTVAALQELALRVRQREKLRVVAVTGSVGKTTSKSILAHLLRRRWKVGETQGSRNSQVGLPAELCNLPSGLDWFVAEAGMSQKGELARLGRILQPEALVYTRIAPVHLEFFPSLQAIAEAKGELIPFLAREGLLVVNAADPWQEPFRQRFAGTVRSYGLARASDLWLESFQPQGLLGSQLVLAGGDLRLSLFLPLAGRHQAENFLAAACLALGLGLPPQELQEAAGTLKPQPHRGEILPLPQGSMLVDDSYNASPTAMMAMLELLAQTPGRKVAVLGEMLELGEQAAQFHQQVGAKAKEVCEGLLAVGGDNARVMAEAFGPQALWAPTVEEAIPLAEQLLAPGSVLLVKGSRLIALDRLVAALGGGA
jgi:UDP-N-acetylmuramoyl-tripeptide--D-alanyl-D-alanine ligase